MASIRFDGVTKRYKDGTLAVDDLQLEIPDGEFLILVGPSGCGKTTALRMLAGLEEVTEGQIVLGDEVVNDVEPGNRDVAMIFQNYALFPHMTVHDNMAFPLRMRRFPKQEVATAVRDAAQLLGLQDLLARRPNQLSGGQRQRVAMGRAIVRRPAAFLMDEPLSNLDAKLRTQMRGELARMHRSLGTTTLYVTHDQTEAMTLGSRVAVMRDGLVQQVGPPQELYRRPANAFVARFIGSPPMNMLRGAIEDGRLRFAGQGDGPGVDVTSRWPRHAGEVLVGIRPEGWTVGSADASDDALSLVGRVEVIEELGAETIVYFDHAASTVDLAGADDGVGDTFAARVSDTARLPAIGSRVTFHASVDALHVFDAATGAALEATPAAVA